MTMLTKELVRAARNMMGNVSCNALGTGGAVLPVAVADLCDTCESLRDEVERLHAEVETWVKVAEVKNRQLDAYDEKAAQAEMVAIERSACQAAMQKMDDLRVVAGAALARAEKAEADVVRLTKERDATARHAIRTENERAERLRAEVERLTKERDTASEPPAVPAPVSTPRDVNEDAVERVARAIYRCDGSTYDFGANDEQEREPYLVRARAAIAALGDPAAEVRAVLREVLAHEEVSIHVEKNNGILTGVVSLTIRVRDKLPADLLKRAEEEAR